MLLADPLHFVDEQQVHDFLRVGVGDDRDVEALAIGLVEDLVRNEHAHLVAALMRTLGPSNLPLAEDVVQDVLLNAMHAWRLGTPRDPNARIVRAARNRAIDIIRRERHGASLLPELATWPRHRHDRRRARPGGRQGKPAGDDVLCLRPGPSSPHARHDDPALALRPLPQGDRAGVPRRHADHR